jgi:hypothetical protein
MSQIVVIAPFHATKFPQPNFPIPEPWLHQEFTHKDLPCYYVKRIWRNELIFQHRRCHHEDWQWIIANLTAVTLVDVFHMSHM